MAPPLANWRSGSGVDASAKPRASEAATGRIGPFVVWLALFYSTWAFIVFGLGHWDDVASHGGIALAMAGGSYVAGSTPMGGGTVGFPILVLLLGEPASMGRSFSFAIQSIGMVSASIFILATRRAVAWRMLRWAFVGSLVGTPLGLVFVTPHLPDLAVKLTFAVIWASFGLLHLVKVREIVGIHGATPATPEFDRALGLAIGLFGGAFMAAQTGVGIDMLLYVVLVLVARTDIKVAIPTSVVIMAFTSLVGLSTSVGLAELDPVRHALPASLFPSWLAAAPVVALGAPFGAFIVARLSRKPTLLIVSILCVGQFVWTLVEEQVAGLQLASTILAVAGFSLLFRLLYGWGRRRAVRAAALACSGSA